MSILESGIIEPYLYKLRKPKTGSYFDRFPKAFEKKVGHPVARFTIYRLLERHDWRKIAPRPRHPKADSEDQDAFKKMAQAH